MRSAIFASAGLLVACSLVVDTDGLSGGPGMSDGGSGEAAAIDATVSESGTTSTDAGPDARFCDLFKPNGTFTFCDDFDDPTRRDVTTGWTRSNVDDNGVLSIVPSGLSAPNALRVDWPANQVGPNGDCSYARLIKDIPGTVSKFAFGFDVFLGDGSGGAFYDDTITDLVWKASASSNYCQLYLRSTVTSPSLNDDNTERPLKEPLTVGAWHRIDMAIDGTTPAGTVTLEVDGKDAFGAPQTLPPGCNGKMELSLLHGLFCAKKNPGAERVLYDNVTFVGD